MSKANRVSCTAWKPEELFSLTRATAAVLSTLPSKVPRMGYASWLNQVEIWFSILVRRLLKRSSFRSTQELRQRILDFIDYFNITMAKPFKWAYAGRPLCK